MADNCFSLVNLDGISEIAKELLEKITGAIGWLATRETPNRIAVQTYIEEIQHGEQNPLVKAALISNAKKIIKEYSNQHNIVRYAIENIREKAQPAKVDDDWISQFMDKARLVSDTDFQMIWGRILAEECNDPGIVPRSLLHILEQMDKNDAERFVKLCSFAVRSKNEQHYMPVYLAAHRDYYAEKGVNYSALVDLCALGLIEMNMGYINTEYKTTCSDVPIEICYFDKHFSMPEDVKEVPIGNVIFTKSGQALCRVIEAEEQKKYFEQYCIPYWEERIMQIRKENSKPK